MTRTIIINEHEYPAFEWVETEAHGTADDPPLPPHARNREVMEEGVSDPRPGEVSFRCDQTIAFDTTLELKGDGRKFVVISHRDGLHIAKPY
jgi:hypothetical protein